MKSENKSPYKSVSVHEIYQFIVEAAPSAMIVVNKEGRITFVNQRAESLFGYTREELLGQAIGKLIPERFRPKHTGHRDSFFADPKARAMGTGRDLLALKKDGTEVPIEVGLSPIKTSEGLFVLASIIDITNRKRVEEELLKFSRAVEQSASVVIITDIKGNIEYVNPKFSEVSGYAKEKVIGKNPRFLKSGRTSLEEYKHLWETITSGGEWRGELINRKKNGEFYCALASISPIRDTRGMITHFLGIEEDITERKKAEDATKESLKSKSAFTSMVSHELRTPLSALKESVSQVLEGMLGTLTEDQRKMLGIAKKNVDRLARLITEVLDFQTLETGKTVFKIQDNDINDVVKETKEIMNIIAKEKGLDFILNLDKELPKIKFDRDKISQVLANIVNNSLKLTEKGSITISTTQGNNVIQASITDTGPGIKEKDMPRLFQQYEQLERKTGGTGLGLAISLAIIMAHGGKIWAESTFGQGTTMHFILPIEERRRKT